MGAMLGGALGSAVGGLSGGPRGHDVGLLVGVVGGAMVGAAVETAAEKQQEKQQMSDEQKYREEKARLAANRAAREEANNASANAHNRDTYNNYYDDDDYYTGDDIIDIDFGDNDSSVEAYSDVPARIELHNIRFYDSDGENVIKRGKEYQISFEIFNAGDATAYNIEPSVKETATNGRIQVSPSILIESLAAHKGVRYTARLGSANALRNGDATFVITCSVDGTPTGEETTFTIPTAKE